MATIVKRIEITNVTAITPVQFTALTKLCHLDDCIYRQLFLDFQTYYMNSDDPSARNETFNKGEIVAVHCPTKKKWCRGQIKEQYDRLRSCIAIVHLVDYAEDTTVPISLLRKLALQFAGIPFRSVVLRLQNVSPVTLTVEVADDLLVTARAAKSWDSHAFIFVKQILKVYSDFMFEITHVESDESFVGSLYMRNDKEKKVCLNNVLVEKEYACFRGESRNSSLLSLAALSNREIRSMDNSPIETNLKGDLNDMRMKTDRILGPLMVTDSEVKTGDNLHLNGMNETKLIGRHSSKNVSNGAHLLNNVSSYAGPSKNISSASKLRKQPNDDFVGCDKYNDLSTAFQSFNKYSTRVSRPNSAQPINDAKETVGWNSSKHVPWSENIASAYNLGTRPKKEEIQPESCDSSINSLTKLVNGVEIKKNISSICNSGIYEKILMLGRDAPPAINTFYDLHFDDLFVDKIEQITAKLNVSVAHMVPSILNLRNAVLVEKSGVDKSLSYLVPLIWLLLGRKGRLYDSLKNSGPIVLILCSDWRAAEKVYTTCKSLLDRCSLIRVKLLHSGLRKERIVQELTGFYEILVATPVAFLREAYADGIRLAEFFDLCHLVFDDADNLLQLFAPEVERIVGRFKEVFKKRGDTSIPNQIVLASCQWTNRLRSFTQNHMRDVLFYCASYLETWVYSGVTTSVSMVEPTEKLQSLLDLLTPQFKSKDRKIIICSSREEELFELEKVLRHFSSSILFAHSKMSFREIADIRAQWTNFDQFGLLLTGDNCLRELGVYDADWVINYNIPSKSKSHLSIRFMCLLNHAQHVIRIAQGKHSDISSRCQVHLMITSKCYFQSQGLIHLLQRLQCKVPPKLKALCLGYYQSNECNKTVQASPVSLCHNLKSYGECHNKCWCQERHLLESVDAPSKVFLAGSYVQVLVTHVSSVNHYFGQILKLKKDDDTEIDVGKQNRELKDEMAYHFAKKTSLIPLLPVNIVVDQVGAYQDPAKIWHRVKVVSKPSGKFSHIQKLKILYLDEGQFEIIDNQKLVTLPAKLMQPSSLTEIYLCNIGPPDKECEWYEDQTQAVRELVEKRLIMGKVALSLGNNLFLTSVNVFTQTELNTPCFEFNVFRKLIRLNLAVENPNHIPTLLEFVENVFSMDADQPSSVNPEIPEHQSQMVPDTPAETIDLNDKNESLPETAFVSNDEIYSTTNVPIPVTKDEVISVIEDEALPVTKVGVVSVIQDQVDIPQHLEEIVCDRPLKPIESRQNLTPTEPENEYEVNESETLTTEKDSNMLMPFTNVLHLNINKMEKVFISSLEDPGLFYVHKLKNIKLLKDLEESLKRNYRHMDRVPLKEMQDNNLPCAVLSTHNFEGRYYRGKLLHLNCENEMANVLRIDYGDVETVEYKNIRRLYDEYLEIENQAIACNLYGIETICGSRCWNLDVGDRMWSLNLDRNQCKKVMIVKALSKKSGVYEVELFDCSGGISVNVAEVLCDEKLAKKQIDKDVKEGVERKGDVSVIVEKETGESDECNNTAEVQVSSPLRKCKPQVEWSATKKNIRLKIMINGVKNYQLKVVSNRLIFETVVGDIVYGFDLELYDALKSETISTTVTPFNVVSTIDKIEMKDWPRLLKTVTKFKWLKANMDHIDLSSGDESDVFQFFKEFNEKFAEFRKNNISEFRGYEEESSEESEEPRSDSSEEDDTT